MSEQGKPIGVCAGMGIGGDLCIERLLDAAGHAGLERLSRVLEDLPREAAEALDYDLSDVVDQWADLWGLNATGEVTP